ncbi:MAG: hypothetical protein COB77_04860 [Gammaproteobacteria bacterium]|nr:MAG: hypothetical protein COB77_04860 [Gammaproteobacteria bacterium]
MIFLLVITSLVLVSFLVNHYIGLVNITNPIVPLYYYHTFFFLIALTYIERYAHVEISASVVYMILYGYIALFFSAVFFYKLLGGRKGAVLARCFHNHLTPSSSYIWAAFIIQTIAIVLILVFYMYKGVLILADDANNYRVDARKGLGFVILMFRWVSELFVVMLSLFLFTSKRKSLLLAILFVSYYIITFFLLLGLGSRSFVLELVLIVIGIFYWSRCRGFDFKLLFTGILFFSVLGLLGVFRQGFDVNAALVFEKAVWRPFVNIQNYQWIVNDFIGNDKLNGESLLIELNTLLPGYQPNFGTWYKEVYGYDFSGGSITVTYLGEAFANFGYAGVFIFPLAIGFFVAIISYICQRRITFIWMFVSIMMSLSLKGIINVGIGATLVGTVFPVVFYICMFFLIRYFILLISQKRDVINV